MFDLSKREKLIILILAAILLAGLFVTAYQKSNSVIDVKIRAFDYAEEGAAIKKININEEDRDALTVLPGVGRSLAMRIVEYRNKNGPFASVEDIKKVSGIKDSLFNKIKDKITIE